MDFTTVRIVLVLATFKNMSIHRLDVKCAFLNHELHEEIYMRLPDSYAPSDGSVRMIKRSIYGLRQVPRAWHIKLAADLARLGYTSFLLRLALKLTVFTCSDVTTVDVSDVQQMSQMPDLSEV
jgi:Reverse transcriptase (RNA-dependent DNA polymerase)